ncbi:MAG: hypothetical protein HY420_01270 [Candidatus Kerfeldbacteria bacterium]|nr:hypothetical protein [Candidatus Kerfeldbacteria bacterium]
MEINSPPNREPKRKYLLPALISALAVLALAGGVLAYYFYFQLSKIEGGPKQSSGEEAANLVKEVSQLIVLPADEIPTIATVADPEKLKDQPFFRSAKKGDKVLIYTNSKKAILYDPAAHKIIEVAPLNIGETSGAVTP